MYIFERNHVHIRGSTTIGAHLAVAKFFDPFSAEMLSSLRYYNLIFFLLQNLRWISQTQNSMMISKPFKTMQKTIFHTKKVSTEKSKSNAHKKWQQKNAKRILEMFFRLQFSTISLYILMNKCIQYAYVHYNITSTHGKRI